MTQAAKKETELKKFFFTFGLGTPFRNNYVEVHAPDYGSARKEMVALFGTKWAFQYSEEEFKGQVEQFNLKRLGDTIICQ